MRQRFTRGAGLQGKRERGRSSTTAPAVSPLTDTPSNLLVNGRREALGIDSPHPQFSWLPPSSGQTAYDVVVTRDGAPVWRSGRTEDPRPFAARYTGPRLASRARYEWRVRTCDPQGTWSAFSEPSWFEMGLLEPLDWRARWISDGQETSRRHAPTEVLYFGRHMHLDSPVVRARAYVSSLGWHKLYLNQRNVTGSAPVPRWTVLDDEVEYQVYDVTSALHQGDIQLGVVVADGRYRGHLGYVDRRAVYGSRLALLAQIEILTADGSTQRVVTDERWMVGHGPIRHADPIHGERVDLRVDSRWLEPGQLPPGARAAVLHRGHVTRRLVAEDVDRVQQIGQRSAVSHVSPSGAQVFDFGQNLTGTARVRLPAGPGVVVTMEYGEALTPDGELDTTYLSERKPKEWFQKDMVILGAQPHTYTADFAIRGFRYLAISGLPRALSDDDVTAVQLGTPLQPTGWFTCSDPRLNQLWHNARWSMVSNYLDTATDCPTRERSGWTGEAQVFAPTAATLFDVRAFDRRYLHNLTLEQHTDGSVPPYIPSEVSALLQKNPKQKWTLSSTGWSDAAVIVPWTLYEYYGDPEVLRAQYGSAKAWVDHVTRRARRRGMRARAGRRVGARERYIVDTGFHFGEWLRPGESGLRSQLHSLVRPPAQVATAYFAHSAGLLAQMASVLDNAADAAQYGELSRQVRAAWHEAFVSRGGARIGDDRQDDYVRALAFDLLPDARERAQAVGRLVELIEAKGDHLDTGFLSTPLLLPALCDNGRADVAYRVLLQDTQPSWLYEVRMGATTMWEKWSGMDEEGHADQSLNHYAQGSVAAFLHQYVAGLRPAAPGWRHMTVEPVLGGGLTRASSEVLTPYGRARSAWRRESDRVVLEVTVSPGARCRARLGAAPWQQLDAGAHELTFSNISV